MPISVNVNATSSSSGSDSSSTAANTTQVVPLIFFTNGTALSYPLLLGGVTSLTTGICVRFDPRII